MNENAPKELSLETPEQEAARLGHMVAGEVPTETAPTAMKEVALAKENGDPDVIAQAELAADAKYIVTPSPTVPETRTNNEQELTSMDQMQAKIQALKSQTQLTDKEQALLKARYEWFKTEAGEQALEKAFKEDLNSTDLYLEAEHPDLLKRIQERRILLAEVEGIENAKEDMETTQLASNPSIVKLVTMDENEAKTHVRNLSRRGMGDYHGFTIDGKDYIAAGKVILADPAMNEDQKLRKLATLDLLIGGYQGGYMDRFQPLIDGKLTEEQKGRIKELQMDIKKAAQE